MKRLLLLLTICALAVAPMLAQTITYTLKGTLGPIESGPDPLGANGAKLTSTATISTSATPTSSTAASVTYSLPVGSVSASLSTGIAFTNTAPWTLKITLATSHDTLVLSGPGPLGTTVTATSHMKANSFTSAVLKHPTSFSPSPQRLTPPKSSLKYSLGGTTTVLGFTGKISD
jgi:hypothetical protein